MKAGYITMMLLLCGAIIHAQNVGIGTTSPDARLDVEGDLILEIGTAVNEFSTDGTLGGNSDIAIPTEQAVKTYVDNAISIGGADNLGNHTATTTLNLSNNNITNVNSITSRNVYSYTKLNLYNGSNYSIGITSGNTGGFVNGNAITFTADNSANAGFVWRDASDATSDGAMTLTTDGRLWVKSTAHFNGNVGIGVSNPGAKLEVAGDINFNGNMLISSDLGSTNVDHIRHDDGDNAWHFVSDASATTTGNSELYSGEIHMPGNVVYAKTTGRTDWGNNDNWQDMTSYTAYLNVKVGDIVTMHGNVGTRLDDGSGDDYYYFRVYAEGTGGCANRYFNQTFYHPNEDGSDHDNFKQVPYLDYWISNCDGTMRFVFQGQNTGDDNFEAEDRVLVVQKH